MKTRTIFYYVHDVKAATAMAQKERVKRNVGFTRDASVFVPADAESCEFVVIMPDVPAHYRKRLEEAYASHPPTRLIAPADAGFDEAEFTVEDGGDQSTQLIEGVARRDTELPEDFEVMTKKELRDYAQSVGIEVNPKLQKRDDIIAAITDSRSKVAA